MKLKCKQCNRKMKVDSKDAIQCSQKPCLLRDDRSSIELDFSNGEMAAEMISEVKVIAVFESEAPVTKTQNDMTPAEWTAWLEQNMKDTSQMSMFD